ncbi:MAG: L-threonylcarbamoyladenylate synthase [Acidobacteria bacterium]|nr:L-threonylcarbamoyladenylate synthase [Acidobacteriota bacterium]
MGRDRRAEIDAAAEWLRGGGLIVFPTETFYGLGADPRVGDGIAALYALKGRDAASPPPLAAGAIEQVELAAPRWREHPLALRLAERFWPGPLSLVLPAAAEVVDTARAPDGSIAIRWTSHPLAAALARALGFALAATSANLAGRPPCTSAEAAVLALGSAPGLRVLDGGETPGGRPSTIVDPRRAPARVLRDGAIPAADILAVARSPWC